MAPNDDVRILQDLANGETMDYSKWPELLPVVLHRLEQIAYTEFTIPELPRQPSSHPPSSPPQFLTQPDSGHVTETPGTHTSSQSTDKENAPPLAEAPAEGNNIEKPDSTLPPQLLAMIASITQTLTAYFNRYPPHTIQRLAELILSPRKHYRTLPSYLHAVDRVVHVTSGANTYPLPAAVPDAFGAKILSNGLIPTGSEDLDALSWGSTTNATVQSSLGSDESLGGALLTPIPWLRNQSALSSNSSSNSTTELEGEVKTEFMETIDGPNGTGRVETVSVSVNGIPSATLASSSALSITRDTNGGLRAEGGVTQGELLRQEQRAGVVPAAQLANKHSAGDGDVEDEESVHARGPDEIGMEDMGPQSVGSGGALHGHGMQGIDVEAAVGRRVEATDVAAYEDTTFKREAGEEIGGDQKRPKDGEEDEHGEQVKNEDGEVTKVDTNENIQDDGKNCGDSSRDAADNMSSKNESTRDPAE